MKLTIDGNMAEARGDFGNLIVEMLSVVEGRKNWRADRGTFRFEATTHNLREFKRVYPHADTSETQANLSQSNDLAESLSELLEESQMGAPAPNLDDWQERCALKPFKGQVATFEKLKDLPQIAIFSEMGTGKTKAMIDIACYRYLKGWIDGAIVIAYPKGVHRQWVNEQLPTHMWPEINYESAYWDEQKFRDPKTDKLQDHCPTRSQMLWLTMNVEMVNGKKGWTAIESFMRAFGDRIMIIIDESYSIKNNSSKRSERITELAALQGDRATSHRAIMTGTPIATDLTDEWSQFKFLNEDIIGMKYKAAFMAQFCITRRGPRGDFVVGHRNMMQFGKLVNPYIFRATKDELGLPPKMYDQIEFELTPEQRRYQEELKESFVTELDSGEIVSAASAIASLVRLQQLSCGFAVDEDDNVIPFDKNPRLDLLKFLVNQDDQKKIVWCRFHHDIDAVAGQFPNDCVTYYGPMSPSEREEAKESWLDPKGPRLFVATAATAGSGLNLQGICHKAIYYSQSFNAIDRWQSEDRIHRAGTKETCMYIDMIGRGSIDRAIVKNLRGKKSLSDLVLDDIRKLVDELG